MKFRHVTFGLCYREMPTGISKITEINECCLKESVSLKISGRSLTGRKSRFAMGFTMVFVNSASLENNIFSRRPSGTAQDAVPPLLCLTAP